MHCPLFQKSALLVYDNRPLFFQILHSIRLARQSTHRSFLMLKIQERRKQQMKKMYFDSSLPATVSTQQASRNDIISPCWGCPPQTPQERSVNNKTKSTSSISIERKGIRKTHYRCQKKRTRSGIVYSVCIESCCI